MNVPKAIEIALAKTLRQFGGLAETVVIRAWQTLPTDAAWSIERDREFPMIDVRCAPPMPDEVQSTLVCECGILMGTNADDDRNHAVISDIYGLVHGVLDDLFAQFRQDDSEENAYGYFLAALDEAIGAESGFAGFTFGQPLAPNDEGGVNMIGATLRIHYHNPAFDY